MRSIRSGHSTFFVRPATVFKYILLTTIFFCLAAAMASAEDENIPVHEFPEDFRAGLERGGTLLRQQLSDALYDGIDNLKLTEMSKEHLSIGLYVGRSVYNNFDVAQSYTVVDSVSVPVTLYSYSLPIGNSHFALQFGIGGNFRMQNIRQVNRRSWKSFERVEERAHAIESTDWFKEADPKFADPGEAPYTEIPKAEGNPLFQLDSLNQARYGEMWRMLAHPARLPLKAGWVQSLDIGEIVTYGGSGFVEFGAAFGVFKNLPELDPAIRGFALSAEYKLFLRGEYRIVILREDENHVKVKVVRRDEYGRRMGINGETPKSYLFDGFVLFGKERNLAGVNLVPFNFQRVDAKGSALEQGFRFDLRDPAAREAYELAVRGRFALADELAETNQGVVERSFRRDADEEYERTSRGIKILLYNQDRSSESRASDAVVTLKDGTHKIYSAVVENRFESRLLFGSRERSVTKATIDFADKVLGIVLEGWIEDSRSDGVELEEYSELVEGVLQRGPIFPRLPVWAPVVEDPYRANQLDPDRNQQAAKLANYGPSAFYFRLDVSQEQVERFIRTPDEEKWKILEQSFGVEAGRWQTAAGRGASRVMNYFGVILNFLFIPVDLRIKEMESLLVADSIFENWVAIGQESDPYRLTKLLAAQFSDRIYGFEMMRVFTRALETRKVPFYLVASSPAFGRVALQEGYRGGAGKTLEEYHREANFENPEIGHNIELTLQDFRVTVLDEKRIELRFNAASRPRVVYFRIDNAGFFHSTKKEIVVLNTGIFQAGENRVVFDKTAKGFPAFLAEAFSEPSNYDVYAGLGDKDHSWGPVSSQRVYYRYTPPPSTR